MNASLPLDPATDAVRDHYDRTSIFYRAFWGDHIHHGLWENGVPANDIKAAQERLVRHLANRAAIPEGARVLDVGCGVGGSARWLARTHAAQVDGITISPVQAEMATRQAEREGVAAQTSFRVHDARALDALPTGYDAVWVVECSEHLPDKAAFITAAARRLRPGGVLALCAWLSGDDLDPAGAALVADVCDGMLCPSLATMDDYRGWVEAAGFATVEAEDLTPRVAATWDRCAAIARRPEVRALLAVSDLPLQRFVAAFAHMQRAYATGAMRYGLFVARMPEET